MILISHRGNTNGKFESCENEPTYIDLSIKKGFEVEVDIWYLGKVLFLGHDKPLYGINFDWLIERKDKLWIHCKNIEAIVYLSNFKCDLRYFWHQDDLMTLTSNGYMWVYPGNQPIIKSIAVLPELFDDDISQCSGICSDYIEKYKNIND